MRTSSAALLLLASGCARSAEKPEGNLIACALGGSDAFVRSCAIQRTATDSGESVVIRRPDGGFRRFAINRDEVAAADGAETVKTTAAARFLEEAVGGDRYRIPRIQSGGVAHAR